jgi:hypothetical protein
MISPMKIHRPYLRTPRRLGTPSSLKQYPLPAVAVGTLVDRAPPAQIRTCGFPASGSHLGSKRLLCAVCVPASVACFPGAESGAYLAGPHFPWSPPLAPPTPPRLAPRSWLRRRAVPLCSPASSLLRRGPTSRVRSSSATAPRLPDAGRQRQCRSGQTRDLPASDAILLHVMWPWTPAGRQHLA